MKKFKISINPIDAEKMWDFAQANQVHVHFVETLQRGFGDLEVFNQKIYVYECLMTPETSTAFALSVPMVSLS